MPDDLHARIRAALTARLEVARAAQEYGWPMLPEWKDSPAVRPWVHHQARNDPATVIRATEAALRMLERHQPDSYGAHCMHCQERCDCMDMTQGDTYEELGEAWSNCTHGSEPWPCPDVRDLADMAGVEVDDEA
jgi:hypothetical protein